MNQFASCRYFFPPWSAIRVQRILYRLMCCLSGSLTCRLPNVMRSPPGGYLSWVQSLLTDFWLLVDEVSTLNLNLLTTQTIVTTGILSHKENSHGRAGNRTRDLVISSQKLWPLDHEAGHIVIAILFIKPSRPRESGTSHIRLGYCRNRIILYTSRAGEEWRFSRGAEMWPW